MLTCILTAQMERVEDAELPEGLWWAADVSPPLDAVVLDFVAFFYEHFDNNDGANHRAAVTFDPRHAACAPRHRLLALRP